MPDRRRYARTPDTILVLLAGVYATSALFFLQAPPGSIVEEFGQAAGMVWLAFTAFAFATAFMGVIWKDELLGWLLELSGRIGVCTLLSAYTVVLLANMQNTGTLFIAALVLALAASSGWRVWQLVRRLSTWRATVGGMKK